uniref:Uncharacterized protein n=1 Tax=Romanomermis culicivorax TaxID=13658 RepID=A0A915JZV7_ROMCU
MKTIYNIQNDSRSIHLKWDWKRKEMLLQMKNLRCTVFARDAVQFFGQSTIDRTLGAVFRRFQGEPSDGRQTSPQNAISGERRMAHYTSVNDTRVAGVDSYGRAF